MDWWRFHYYGEQWTGPDNRTATAGGPERKGQPQGAAGKWHSDLDSVCAVSAGRSITLRFLAAHAVARGGRASPSNSSAVSGAQDAGGTGGWAAPAHFLSGGGHSQRAPETFWGG